MTQSPYFRSILNLIAKKLPETFAHISQHQDLNPNLFSPFQLELPGTVLEQAEEFVREIYNLKEASIYQDKVGFSDPAPVVPSVLTCFDFHYTKDMGLKLIEINTNASLYPLLALSREVQDLGNFDDLMEELWRTFASTFDFKQAQELSIIDLEPSKEGLYPEFLLYQEWFQQKGIHCNVIGVNEYKEKALANVYNRYTDFYFDEDHSLELRNDYLNRNKYISPNPREYFLLADKKRLNILRSFLMEQESSHASIIPETKLFSEFESAEQIWAQRKQYFFKPSQSFGSKGVYSGKSISKKAFESIYDPSFIAQESCPAGKRDFVFENETHTMKFDLRFFTYAGEIQNYGARLYQGQATNMRTHLGGLAPIRWT